MKMEKCFRVFSPSFAEILSSSLKREVTPKGFYIQHNLIWDRIVSEYGGKCSFTYRTLKLLREPFLCSPTRHTFLKETVQK